jgi:hypothetical protein
MALGICALALGLLVAIGASTASGEKGAGWKIVGETLSALLKPSLEGESVVPEGGKTPEMTLIAKAGGFLYELQCQKVTLTGFFLISGGSGSGKALFSQCKFVFFLEGKLVQECPISSGGKGGVVSTEPLNALIVLHKGEKTETLIRIEPQKPEGRLATFTFGECVVFEGEESPISGVIYLREREGELETEQIQHVFEVGALTELTWGTLAAIPAGAGAVKLAGVHTGQKWSGFPG